MNDGGAHVPVAEAKATEVASEASSGEIGSSGGLHLVTVLEEEFTEIHEAPLPPGPAGDTPQERLSRLFTAIHALPGGRTALCLSGGGIRSATFSLGVLQTLARLGCLERFDYLSTVSGGGYIGGWLSAWLAREGKPEVFAGLKGNAPAPTTEPKAIRNLRAYSHYLNPKAGLLSVDTWAVGVIFVRNLLINWLVLLPLVATLVLLPRALLALFAWRPFSAQAPLTAAVLGGVLAAGGLLYVVRDLPGNGRQGGRVRRFKWLCLAPLATACALLTLAWRWADGAQRGAATVTWFAFGGAVLHALAAALSLATLLRSRANVPPSAAVPPPHLRSWWHLTLRTLAVIASGAIGGVLAWVGAARLFAQPSRDPELYLVFAPPWLVLSLLGATTVHIALAGTVSPEGDREWWARAGAWLAVVAAVWLAIVGVSVSVAAPALRAWAQGQAHVALADAWAYVSGAGGLVGALTALAGNRSGTGLGKLAPVRSLLERYGLTLGAGLFALALFLTMTLGVDAAITAEAPMRWSWLPTRNLAAAGFAADGDVEGRQAFYTLVWTLTLLVGSAGATVLLSWFVGINRFSLHAMYGNRLVRAYLGASQPPHGRHEHPLTGFDPHDNLPLCRLRRGGGPKSVRREDLHPGRPFHVVNMTLNLVRCDHLAWQQRKAKSFTASPLHCGSWNGLDPTRVCYRRTERYDHSMTLGKAITISGAAASPNMGYHSSRLVGLVMTFFNARLGWWLGNPDCAQSWRKSEPALALRPFVDEALGLTNDEGPYVYLSDGGHFENLGLYEMVLRRCHTIVVVDAGGDPKLRFGDLSEAIRKIRADLGIAITLHSDKVTDERPWLEGTIHYSDVDREEGPVDGKLFVLKPIVTKGAPHDVHAYAQEHADPKNPFPQQSTADQFFDEAQFESYRALGAHVAELAAKEPAIAMRLLPNGAANPGLRGVVGCNLARAGGHGDFTGQVPSGTGEGMGGRDVHGGASEVVGNGTGSASADAADHAGSRVTSGRAPTSVALPTDMSIASKRQRMSRRMLSHGHVAVVDTNVTIEVHSYHDWYVAARDHQAAGGGATTSKLVDYRKMRARDSAILAAHFGRTSAKTHHYLPEAIEQMLRAVPRRTSHRLDVRTIYTEFYAHFVKEEVLSAWVQYPFGAIKKRRGTSADKYIVSYAKAHSLPLVTNEGLRTDGTVDDSQGMRRRAHDASVRVFTPGQFLQTHGVDENSEGNYFLNKFEELAEAHLAERERWWSRDDGGREYMGDLYGFYEYLFAPLYRMGRRQPVAEG